MDTIERIAISEPLCAKILALNAINKEDPEREEKYKACNLVIPPVGLAKIELGWKWDLLTLYLVYQPRVV